MKTFFSFICYNKIQTVFIYIYFFPQLTTRNIWPLNIPFIVCFLLFASSMSRVLYARVSKYMAGWSLLYINQIYKYCTSIPILPALIKKLKQKEKQNLPFKLFTIKSIPESLAWTISSFLISTIRLHIPTPYVMRFTPRLKQPISAQKNIYYSKRSIYIHNSSYKSVGESLYEEMSSARIILAWR